MAEDFVLPATKPQDHKIWPENRPAWGLFLRVLTQWRIGMSGATGLDYATVYPLIDKMADDQADWWHLFDGLQACEAEALAVFANRHKDD